MVDIPILLFLLVLIAVLLRLDVVFYLVYVGAGTYALARWWTSRSLLGLRLSRHFDDHVFLGQPVAIKVAIENQSWLPVLWLRLDETVPLNLALGDTVRQVVSLGPRSQADFCYQLVGRRRGYYAVGPALLHTGDLFGFAEARWQTAGTGHLTVYPQIVPLAQVDLRCRLPYGTIKSQQRIFADPTRIAAKRDYQPGDPQRDIDWKTTARLSALQVKKYDPAISLTSAVFVNLNKEEFGKQTTHEMSEWGIVVAASLANYLIGQRQAVGLASNGLDPVTGARCWDIPPKSGRPHLMKLLEWLARVQLTESIGACDWISRAAQSLAWGTTVIIVNPGGDEAVCRTAHQLVRMGLNPVLIVTEPHYQFSLVRERARRLGFAAHQVSDERDLKRLGR